MTMMRARTLMPTLEPKMAAVSERQKEKESQVHTVRFTWAKDDRAGLPASVTCTVTAYSPTSSSPRAWSQTWVPGGRVRG